jgi:flagellar basal body-associated protein FliL
MEKIEYKISKEIRDAILNYLLSRPMAEVESGVQALRQLEEIKNPE